MRQQDGVAADLLVSQVVLRYDDFAKGYYIKDSEPGKECVEIKLAMRPLLRLYGAAKAMDFGPLALKAVRQPGRVPQRRICPTRFATVPRWWRG